MNRRQTLRCLAGALPVWVWAPQVGAQAVKQAMHIDAFQLGESVEVGGLRFAFGRTM